MPQWTESTLMQRVSQSQFFALHLNELNINSRSCSSACLYTIYLVQGILRGNVILRSNIVVAECLLHDQFVMKLTYLSDIFLKLNELNLYLQGADISLVHD